MRPLPSLRPAPILRAVAAVAAVALGIAPFAGAVTPHKTTVDMARTKATQPGVQVHLAGRILPRAAASPKQGSGSISVVEIAVNGKKVIPTSMGNAIQPAANGTFVFKAIVAVGSTTFRVKFRPPFNGRWRVSTAVVTVTMTG